MLSFLTFVHVALCLFIILIVLIQGGKGADMGAAFGGSSQTVFGSSGGATFFTKLTTAIASLFFASCIILAITTAKRTSDSVVPTTTDGVQETIPATNDPKANQPAKPAEEKAEEK